MTWIRGRLTLHLPRGTPLARPHPFHLDSRESATMNVHRLDRRDFLRTGAATVLAAAGLPTLVRSEDKKDGRFGPFLVGAQSYTFREFDLEQCLKHMQDLGLHYAEFSQKHVPIH